MYKTNKKYITPEMKLADLIYDNPSFLLFIEHLGIDFLVKEKNIIQICSESNISVDTFITLANMFYGFPISFPGNFTKNDIPVIILFLTNSHNYFEKEKFPEIKELINRLYSANQLPEIKLTGKFFDEYFEEVKEHLIFENTRVFPYVEELYDKKPHSTPFSSSNYSEHHTDIEYKLKELRELLLKHIPVQQDRVLRRKIITSLFELEYYLFVHSEIEEKVLIPLINLIEKDSV